MTQKKMKQLLAQMALPNVIDYFDLIVGNFNAGNIDKCRELFYSLDVGAQDEFLDHYVPDNDLDCEWGILSVLTSGGLPQ